MKRNYYLILLMFLFTIFNTKLNAQHVDAGEDFYVCSDATEVTLRPNLRLVASLFFEVESIPFQWDGDLTGTEVETLRYGFPQPLNDDSFSKVIEFPLDFNFLGNPHDFIIIGSNGAVVFELLAANKMNEYDQFNSGVLIPDYHLPYWDETNYISSDAVFGAAQDINPGVRDVPGLNTTIQYKIVGQAPYRKFVITYNEIPQFGCDDKDVSQQIILYETTDIIEVYIKKREICQSWSHNAVAIGVQTGDIPNPCGIAPPGRNTGLWEIPESSPEGWRFSPDLSPVSVKWYDSNRNLISTDFEPTVPFNPVNGQETYTMEVSYSDCLGNNYTEFDDVTVSKYPSPQVNLPSEEIKICPHQEISFDGSVTNASDFQSVAYTWTDDSGNVVSNDAVFTTGNQGEYYLTVETNGSCTKTFGPVKLSKYETCKIPEGISPNGDGLNDSFVLDWLASNPGIDILQIYDRRGVLVYEKDNYIDEFVGKNNDGNDLPAASYYYIIKLLNGEKMTGWFQLVR